MYSTDDIAIGRARILLSWHLILLKLSCSSLVLLGCLQIQEAFQSLTTLVRNVLAALLELLAETHSAFCCSNTASHCSCISVCCAGHGTLLHLTPGKHEVMRTDSPGKLTWVLVLAREKLWGKGLLSSLHACSLCPS